MYPALGRIRGHNMAKAGVEMAMWELKRGHQDSRCQGARRHARSIAPAFDRYSGFARQLLDKIEQELAAGYQRIKIKIKPGWDVDASAVRATFPHQLMADANSAYTLDDAAL